MRKRKGRQKHKRFAGSRGGPVTNLHQEKSDQGRWGGFRLCGGVLEHKKEVRGGQWEEIGGGGPGMQKIEAGGGRTAKALWSRTGGRWKEHGGGLRTTQKKSRGKLFRERKSRNRECGKQIRIVKEKGKGPGRIQ